MRRRRDGMRNADFWNVARTSASARAVNGLLTAITRRSPVGTVIVHSVRGARSVPRATIRRRAQGHNKLSGSMGRVAAAGDNAAMESFFAQQKRVLDRHA